MSKPAWDDLSFAFGLSDARVVASIKDGGAVVETGLTLAFLEGRRQVWSGTQDGDVSELEYYLEFELEGGEPPEANDYVQARIVVEGMHDNGERLEIRGEGWIGFDDRSRISGHFLSPPRMFVDASVDEEPEAGDHATAPVHDFVMKEAKPSPQFERALYGRMIEDHHGVPSEW